MSRIGTVYFLKSQNRKALVTFIVAGDPVAILPVNIEISANNEAADIIELRMPFTDPMADGAAIQAADHKGFGQRDDLGKTLEMVAAFRRDFFPTPIVLMGYFNPVYSYGVAAFVKDAATAGVDGLIIVDLPPEEDAELRAPAQKAGLDLIRLVTPTTTPERLPDR